jgi:hypothetical protein
MTDRERDILARLLGIPTDAVDIVASDAGVRRAIKRAIDRANQQREKRGRKLVWTPLKKRQLARKVRRFSARHRQTSQTAILRDFATRAGAPARANVKRGGGDSLSVRTLQNRAGQGEALLQFMDDPLFRRWARALDADLSFFAKRRFWQEIRAALNSDKPGDLSGFAKLADEAQLFRIAGERALFGELRDSFVIIDNK